MAVKITVRLPDKQIKLINSLVKKKIFRSRTRAIEMFVQEGLEKRNLINYEEVLAEEVLAE